jgi:thymidylate synthase
MNKNNQLDTQYTQIIKDILDDGVDRNDRTGIGSRAVWGKTISLNLENGFPAITCRKVNPRIAFEEIMWIVRGQTDSKILEKKKINIWKGNTSREFLDSHHLNFLPEGQIGKSYGFQMRNFGGTYGMTYDEHLSGVDQFKELLKLLKKDPDGRRHIVSLWNPQQLSEMALPPCHLYQQYQILDGRLNSSFVMRSWDFIFGAPYNIMGYAFLNHIISNYLGISSGTLFGVGMDVHIYKNQIEMSNKILKNIEFYDLPTLTIKKKLNSLDDILSLEFSDIELNNYEAYPDVLEKPKMAI